MAKLSEFVTLAIILKNGLKANNLQNRGAADQRANYQPTTNDMIEQIPEQIQKLTEAQAKLLLEYAMRDLRNAIYNPAPAVDASTLGWLTQKIETLSKENSEQ
jgi:hypothetical protein